MTITRSLVERCAEEYRESEALYAVERENVDLLPGAFARDDFGKRDAEWVVRWYYRRFLGAYPDADRRRIEEAFERNEFETVRGAILDAVDAVNADDAGVDDSVDVAAAVDRLTDLAGVDVPVASAFLAFIDPDRFIVVGEREWSVLREHGELDEPYPEPVTVPEYERYLETCRAVAERVDCDLYTLYQTLWRLWKAE
ncbi:MAG: hypothetical protein ABEJ74_06985 [Haloferacaceae archaeon]